MKACNIIMYMSIARRHHEIQENQIVSNSTMSKLKDICEKGNGDGKCNESVTQFLRQIFKMMSSLSL